jgi:hypothetical protein
VLDDGIDVSRSVVEAFTCVNEDGRLVEDWLGDWSSGLDEAVLLSSMAAHGQRMLLGL